MHLLPSQPVFSRCGCERLIFDGLTPNTKSPCFGPPFPHYLLSWLLIRYPGNPEGYPNLPRRFFFQLASPSTEPFTSYTSTPKVQFPFPYIPVPQTVEDANPLPRRHPSVAPPLDNLLPSLPREMTPPFLAPPQNRSPLDGFSFVLFTLSFLPVSFSLTCTNPPPFLLMQTPVFRVYPRISSTTFFPYRMTLRVY